MHQALKSHADAGSRAWPCTSVSRSAGWKLTSTHEMVVAEAAVSASAVGASSAAGSVEALQGHHPPCQPAAREQSFGRVPDMLCGDGRRGPSMRSRSGAPCHESSMLV